MKFLFLPIIILISQNASAWRCTESCSFSYLRVKGECIAWHEVQCNDFSLQGWKIAGQSLYPSAAATMKLRNGHGEQLSERLKQALRPVFGNIVDRVRVKWNAGMLDSWGGGNYKVNLSSVDTAAQTYGYEIYMTYSKRQLEANPHILATLIHEMAHTKQYVDKGSSLMNFGGDYFNCIEHYTSQKASNRNENSRQIYCRASIYKR